MRKIVSFILTAALFVLLVNAQPPYSEKDKLFYEAKQMFAVKNYVGAAEKFSLYKQLGTDPDLLQEAEYYLAAAAFERKSGKADELLDSYIKNNHSGRHTTNARFYKASLRFFDEHYAHAIDDFKQIDPDMLASNDRDDYFYRLSISMLKENRLKDAEQLFVVVSEASRKYKVEAAYYLGYIAYCNGDFKKALPVMERFQSDPRFELTAPYYIAQIKYAQRNYEEVLSIGNKLLNSPTGAKVEKENINELTRVVGEAAFYTGDSKRAQTLLTTYAANEPNPVRDGLYVLGVTLYENANFDKALAHFYQVTGPNDDMTQSAYLYIGQILIKQGDKKAARLAFESAMNSGSSVEIRETAMYNYAMTIHETSFSLFDESVNIFERFLNEFPNSQYTEKINDCLIEVYMTTKNYQAALNSILKIKTPNTKILKAKQRLLFQMGTQYVANADFRSAIQSFNEVVKLGDLDIETKAEALFWRGECLYRSALYNQAVKDFQAFLSLTKGKEKYIYTLAQYNMGYAYFKMQDFSNAMRWFNGFINADNGRNKDLYADAFNRIGDCHFDRREFASAETFYNRAAEVFPNSADYALYQKGFVAGLQKNYPQKIAAMDRLINEMPTSPYVDDALFEKGRTYFLQEQYPQAEGTFKQLMAQFPQTDMARKGSIQLGLLYFNTNQLQKAIDAYKFVITNFPGSEEAATAVQDLKSVYMELNDIDAYAQYIRSVQGGVRFEASEQDSLTYLSAEKIFMRGDMGAAERSMSNYLQRFPDGTFVSHANYYMGAIAYQNKDYSKASDCFDRVLTRPQSKFTEDAMAGASEIAYLNNDFNKALPLFKQLEVSASKPENIKAARLGVLRCAYKLNKENDALLAANAILSQANLSPELRQEALFVRANILIAGGQQAKAAPDLIELSKDTRNAFGAEGSYLLAKVYADTDRTKKAEETILAFMEKGTPHQYWMARSFLLLADIYIATERALDAKQYLLSLQSNYKANDEIAGEIEKRLSKIK